MPMLKSPMPNMIDWTLRTIEGQEVHTLMVTGSREYNDMRQMDTILREYAVSHSERYPDVPLVLISGHAQRGADVLAEMIWPEFGPVLTVPAEWQEHTPGRCKCGEGADYCKLAGIIRNEVMVERYTPSVVVAFYSPTAENRGTNHAAEYASGQGIPVRTVLEQPKVSLVKVPKDEPVETTEPTGFITASL